MYRLIGVKQLFIPILVIYTLVHLVVHQGFGLPTLKSVTWTLGLVALIGETKLFVWLCRLPFIQDCFPPIDGRYSVEISSNWNLVSQRLPEADHRAPDVGPLVRRGSAKIRARLLSVHITLDMDDGYLRSRTLTCDVGRSPGGDVQLMYVYASTIDKPHPTDSSAHQGAALVRIPTDRPIRELKGNYWTDRNWHKGLNTAGEIRLIREG